MHGSDIPMVHKHVKHTPLCRCLCTSMCKLPKCFKSKTHFLKK